jgi:predicted PurR-regulated permease PerM
MGFLAFILGYIPNVGLIIATLPAVIIAFILYGWGTALAILAIGIALNAAMDNAVTPRIMGKGLNLPILLVHHYSLSAQHVDSAVAVLALQFHHHTLDDTS